ELGLTTMSRAPDPRHFPPVPDGGPENAWGQDRALMKKGHFSGFPQHLFTEDFAILMAQGRIADRTKESLNSGDLAVVKTRQLMLRAVKEFMAGEVPRLAHLESAAYTKAAEHAGVLPEGTDWRLAFA